MLLDKYQTSTNELEDKIIALYAKGVSTRDIQDTVHELYGVEVSAQAISTITDKVWGLVEAWQNRPLAAVYPIIYLDAIHLKIRRDGRVVNTAVYIVLGVEVDGQRDVLGHWVGDGAEGANFWLSVVTVEGYNRQLRKVVKTRGAMPYNDATRKLLFLVNREIVKDWTAPICNWAKIRNQLAIRFEGWRPL